MASTSQEWRFEKLGHDGFPVVVDPDTAEHGYGHADVDGPPPPSYDETFMQGGSAVSYSGASSSSQAYSTQLAAITASSTSLYGSGSSSDPPVTGSTSRASSSRLRPDNEGVREPHYRPQAPHVLLPPAAPPPLAGPNDESFSRAPPRNLSYDPFPPAVLYARGNDLVHDGFPLEPPACSCAPQPHPFITHDVNEDDWTRFLRDVKGAGGLTPVDSMIADVAPRAVKTGLLIGFIADMALRAHVEGKKKNPVADVIADWNKCFFHPRLMEVTLAQGAVTYTGPEGALPPDMTWDTHHGPRDNGGRYAGTGPRHDEQHGRRERHAGMGRRGLGGLGRRWDDDNSASEMNHDPGRTGRRGLVGGLRDLAGIGGSGLGAADRRERVDYSRDLQASAKEKWRMILTYKPRAV